MTSTLFIITSLSSMMQADENYQQHDTAQWHKGNRI